ncbi:MAG: 1,4-dihydroxy-6-naphthoate synthase [Ferruginibacter sp.]
MKLTLGYSPCPNDTFIFDAIANKKIDTGQFEFDIVLEDVQTLNKWATESKLDVSKISYGVLPLVLENYAVLDSGSALGSGVGPLLIRNDESGMMNVEEQAIAIPGENTTAHLLFSLAYPEAKNKVFLRYDQIEQFVLDGKGPGVIIHENRFTYEQKGLHKIVDLGDFWEQKTGYAIPLGGIAVNKKISREKALQLDALIKQSIEYSYANYPVLSDYIKQHAQEMSEDVMRKHIDLYVNDYSMGLGPDGRDAIKKLLQVYEQSNAKVIDHNGIFA